VTNLYSGALTVK